ncbi:uncharacterized protein B0I36DRAFT_373802 [Microdochium trichocladiopsis]|uniref:TauD/TfdA-like domain-containing protein n=1 Tax=Microdochium trichocladiopsis TaxID=1682393 RepID=A0A9P9BSG4_9PEZI|nr:uncharacterized protein B0I36DRAFT_373802 [Microdochium trichocladiopsis]KAH7033703.1 hypothetical protein B0I36DRAFT_373802 [Microdochium trichocladiopsis]
MALSTPPPSAPVFSVTKAAQPPPGQPDIAYHPDWDKYQARTARRLKTETLPSELPEGFPKKLTGALVWDGATLAKEYDWTYVLSHEQLDEIDKAVKHFQSLNLAFGYITQETFPLPNLHDELRRLSRELHFGHGFFVLRGLDVDKYTREENIIIYAGVSSHIGSVRGRQDAYFEGKRADVVVGHIRDVRSGLGKGRDSAKIKIGTPAYTSDKQVFHTDSGDIVSLFALSTAAEGGASRLASTWQVYNHLAATRPDLIHTLSSIWVAELFTKTVDDKDRYMSRPLLYHTPASADGKTPDRVLLQYGRRYYVGFGELPRSSHLPPISEAQAEALDALHFLGERFSGDMQFVNNVAIFHARDGYTDSEETQRHLLRIWIRDPEYAWETPKPLASRWDRVYGGVTPELQTFPLQPHTRSESTPANK